jgi:hypothetical protein
MTAQIPMGRVGTLYATVGDAFAWLCLVGLVGVFTESVFRPR